jgi:hypothetical protein
MSELINVCRFSHHTDTNGLTKAQLNRRRTILSRVYIDSQERLSVVITAKDNFLSFLHSNFSLVLTTFDSKVFDHSGGLKRGELIFPQAGSFDMTSNKPEQIRQLHTLYSHLSEEGVSELAKIINPYLPSMLGNVAYTIKRHTVTVSFTLKTMPLIILSSTLYAAKVANSGNGEYPITLSLMSG